MHYSIPSRAESQFKPKSGRNESTPFLLKLLSPILHPLSSVVGGSNGIGSKGGSMTAFERKRRASARTTKSALVLVVMVVGLIFFALYYTMAGRVSRGRSPRIVLVLGLDNARYKESYLNRIIENRKEYAEAHGYGLYVRYISEFGALVNPIDNVVLYDWAKLPLMRAAMQDNPNGKYFWYLDQNAIIMNPNIVLDRDILESRKLNSLVLRDVPVIPPDGAIRTYRHVPVDRMKFIITQDHDGFQPASFILLNEEYSYYVLDAWFDKLYREYKFEKGSKSALDHIAQWHPTVLSKMAVIPQRILNSYPSGVGDSQYQDGDFVASLTGCDSPERSCTREFDRLWDVRGRAVK
ncbi:galactosyl transferase GMA12/MNN10 family-domain-containing protein [Dipodascopsis uninucleata]